MNTINLAENLKLSRLVHGHWRLASWNLSKEALLSLTENIIELGITSFDHADIYGDYSCEHMFGEALSLNKSLRQDIQIITKCGISKISEKYPERKIKHYNYNFEYIVESAEKSLKNLKTDYLDLLLLHRPSPFMNPEEIAKAFSYLKQSGKVLYFGVSNFTISQMDMLNAYTEDKLVTNQVEISPYRLDQFENGNVDYFLKEKLHPMIWSPLAGGRLFSPNDEKSKRIFKALQEISDELAIPEIEKILYAWLLNHPATMIPIVGSGKIERIRFAVEAMDLKLNLEQWFKIYSASTGQEIP